MIADWDGVYFARARKKAEIKEIADVKDHERK
jgi:hypothetical protein